MKCIQALKHTREAKTGEIIRVSDADAHSKVDNRYWKYASKSEWKTSSKEQNKEKQQDGNSIVK